MQEAEEQLQHSYREQDRLEKQRAKLEHELASWSAKLGVDIQLPKSDSVDGSDASASSKVCVVLYVYFSCYNASDVLAFIAGASVNVPNHGAQLLGHCKLVACTTYTSSILLSVVTLTHA